MKYYGLFSGGKDSLVTCHYMWQKGELDDVVYCRTGIGLDENVDFVKSTCKKYNWNLNIVEPKIGETYEDFVRRFGFPHSGAHNMIMGFLKWHPLRKFARDHKDEDFMFVSGRRQKESKRRMRIAKSQHEEPEKNMKFYSPLLYWSTKDVWQYVKDNELEICPVYETLHMSGDCLCGAFAELGEAELIATFHGYMANKIKTLEEKYKDKWGNNSSMCGAMKQGKIVDFICNECIRGGD